MQSNLYAMRGGLPDDHAWERAHARYRANDVQDARPAGLAQLELPHAR